jgi:hypothetical protein
MGKKDKKMRKTETYAVLEVSDAAHLEISSLLRRAGYDHVFQEGERNGRDLILMNGIALAVKPAPLEVDEEAFLQDEMPEARPEEVRTPEMVFAQDVQKAFKHMNELLTKAAEMGIDVDIETRETNRIDKPVKQVHLFGTFKQIMLKV